MKKKEISAIDSIYEILDRIKKIEDHYNILNKQNALINNKLNKINDILENKKDFSKEINSIKPKASQKPLEEEAKAGLVLGNIKMYSTLLTPNREPIPDVIVKIFDIKNSIIRNMLTDSKGYWEARLPSGRYRVTMDHDNFKTIERMINLDGKQKNVEVV